jgi:hypothetical protein
MRTETLDSTEVRAQIEALRHMTTGQLKAKYHKVFGESTRSNHKQFLFRRIARRIQANAWAGLSERARRRALEIANDTDLRILAPKNFSIDEVDPDRTLETKVAPTADRFVMTSEANQNQCRIPQFVALLAASVGGKIRPLNPPLSLPKASLTRLRRSSSRIASSSTIPRSSRLLPV